MAPPQPFAIRGTNFNMVVLQLRDGTPDIVIPALERLIQQSPAFLRDSPIVLGLDELPANGSQPDFIGLAKGLRDLRLVPVGTTGGTGSLRQAAVAAGLSQMNKGQQLFKPKAVSEVEELQPDTPVSDQPTISAAAAVVPEPDSIEPKAESAPAEAQPALLVTTPVRAGNRIYAQGRDIICTATVNAGAEIIADGHVHVYGALRGRAIAGAQGFDEARIFALNFDPELIAIAGLYRVRDDVDPALIGQRLQISLSGEEMRFTPLG
jgi:septum site-determining protein MinC